MRFGHHPQWSYETIVKWKIKKRYISISARFMVTKPVMAYNDGLSRTKSRDSLIA